MKNDSQNEIPSKCIKLISNNEKDIKVGKLFLKNFVHKNTAPSYKIKKAENNIFSIYKNNPSNHRNSLIRSKDFLNSFQINNNSNSNIFSIKRKISQNLRESNSMIQNITTNNNLNNLFKLNQNSKADNTQIFPYINNFDKTNQEEKSILLKKESKEVFKKIKFLNNNNTRGQSVHNKKPQKKFSNVVVNKFDKSDREGKKFKLSKKFLKMKTFLEVNKDIDLLINEQKLKKEIEENNDDNTKKDGKGILNQKLLYSKKVNNYIVKIYKAVDQKLIRNQQKKNGLDFYKSINKDKSPKYYIMDYLNNFDPKKYIQKIKDKIEKVNIGNSKKSKKDLLKKTYENIEYLINKKLKNFQKHLDILDKIKIKNKVLISKKRRGYIQKKINEILLKINFKHKKLIFNFHSNNLIISQFINFDIHLKLNIMRHVLTKSERDENIYFINLIKHLLYSGQQNMLKYPLMKSFRKMFPTPLHKSTTIENYMQFNNKKIYYLYFSIKFQLIDSETILKPFISKNFLYNNKKKADKDTSTNKGEKDESLAENSSELYSTIEKRIKISHSNRKSKRLKDIIKFMSRRKVILDFNLTKSIINLRNLNIEEELNSKNSNMKKLKNLKNLYNKNKESSSSSDSFDYKKKSQKILRKKSSIILTDRTIKEDNEEIHQRYKKLIFDHFFSCVKYSQYDKLIRNLRKFSKYIDLNYRQDNGDTLLHLCVRYSLPYHFYKFLVNHGVNINAQNNDGDTVLHLAAKIHKYRLIDLLINLGASEYIYNKMEKNCWDCL